MIETGYYIVTQSIAQKCGNIDNCHRIVDGRYIVTSRHLKAVLPSKEGASNNEEITEVTRDEALRLIKENGFKKGCCSTISGKEVKNEENKEE